MSPTSFFKRKCYQYCEHVDTIMLFTTVSSRSAVIFLNFNRNRTMMTRFWFGLYSRHAVLHLSVTCFGMYQALWCPISIMKLHSSTSSLVTRRDFCLLKPEHNALPLKSIHTGGRPLESNHLSYMNSFYTSNNYRFLHYSPHQEALATLLQSVEHK